MKYNLGRALTTRANYLAIFIWHPQSWPQHVLNLLHVTHIFLENIYIYSMYHKEVLFLKVLLTSSSLQKLYLLTLLEPDKKCWLKVAFGGQKEDNLPYTNLNSFRSFWKWFELPTANTVQFVAYTLCTVAWSIFSQKHSSNSTVE